MKTLDINQTLQCARASKLVYATGSALQQEKNQLGFGNYNVRFIEKHNHVAVVIESESESIFAFRGTELGDFRDWKTNTHIEPIATSLGEVHSGFWDAVHLFEEELLQFAEKRTKCELFLTGHSLGGAMACLACVELDTALNGVYTFAQPPIGTHEFGQHFIEKFGQAYYRVVNVLDDVPNIPIPFINAAKALRPMGNSFMLNKNGKINAKPSFWSTIPDRWAVARNPSQRYMFELHSIDEHIKRLSLAQNNT